MLKLARWSTTHRKYVVIGWLLLLIGVNAFAHSIGTSYSNNFNLPNSDAQRALDLLQRSFPAQSGDRDTIVFQTSSGTVRDPAVRARMSSTLAAVARLPHVTEVISPYAASTGGRQISPDQRIAFATVVFDETASSLPGSAAKRVISVASAAQRPGLQVDLGGEAIEGTEQSGFGLSTAVGLMAAIVVLLLTFGSVVAMGLPIVTALFGLGTGLGAIALFTHVVDTPDFSSELAAMIGLGVGIDYALFILTRFREAYATPGPTFHDVHESVVRSIDTAGRAVLFAGCTVVIALLGMMLLGVTFLYGVAISASMGVLLVMLASLTLLPALLTLAGARVAVGGRRARARAKAAASEAAGEGTLTGSSTGWMRWSAFIHRHPATIAAVSGLIMILIAAPAAALRLGSSDAANDPASQTTHRAYEMLAEGFGQGFNGPLTIAVRIPEPNPRAGEAGAKLAARPPDAGSSLAELRAAIAATPGVQSVLAPRVNPTGTAATITAYPTSSPQAYATSELVSRLRSSVVPAIEARTGLGVYVGGVTAGAVDFASTLSEKLPLFIGVVVLVSALLLLVVFRSLLVPLQAAVMNLLSIGASLGVIVAIFQWGWLGGLLGVQQGPIESFLPVMLFAIVFGLSMDYEVFLISRIHERWAHTKDNSRAVAEGLALTGRVVTAAATIMVLVFLSFMLGEDRIIKEFGLALASAVFLDALVVRCLLLPATLHLLGENTWWIPGWLDRVLPRLNVEGSPLPPEEPKEPGRGGACPTGDSRGLAVVATGGADA